MDAQAIKRIVVQKFGGTSLASEESMHRAASHIAATRRRGVNVVVVVSARGDTTDQLVAMVAALVPDQPGAAELREIDQLVSTGENVSAATMALTLLGLGVGAVSLTASQIGLQARGTHGEGRIHRIDEDRLRQHLARHGVLVVAGFQGIDAEGSILTLGRGGSDTTAAALAAALGAERCEIYTDVSGVYTADPRLLPEARLIPTISTAAMAEMAYAGARVLHPRAVELASLHGVDLVVRSSTLLNAGTLVTQKETVPMIEPVDTVTAVVHDLDVAHVRVESDQPDPMREVLDRLGRLSVEVDMLSTSNAGDGYASFAFTVRRSQLPLAVDVLRDVADRGSLRVETEVAKVSVVGTGLLSRPHYISRMLACLAQEGLTVSWLSLSQARVSVVVALESATDAVRVLHNHFTAESVSAVAARA